MLAQSGDLAANEQKYYQYGGNPGTILGQLTAMANYIASSRYGDPSAAWAHEESAGWYYGGGLVDSKLKTTPVPKPTKTKDPAKPKDSNKLLSTKQLAILSAAGGKIGALQDSINDLNAQYTGLSSYYEVYEQSPQFLNSDGSMNAAGLAQATTDNQTLLGLLTPMLADYQAELPLVEGALGHVIGKQGTVDKEVAANRAIIAANKLKESSIRVSLAKLKAPTGLSSKYASLTSALDTARAKGETTKETAPLRDAISAVKAQMVKSANQIKQEEYPLQSRLADLLKQNTTLSTKDTSLSQLLGGNASSSDPGINSIVTTLEADASNFGTPEWGKNGQFLGIDTTNQGVILSTQTLIDGLNNTITTLGTESSGTTDTTSTALEQLLEQQNLFLSEQVALSTADFATLNQFIPEIPQFASGGPVLDDGLIYAHAGEHVVPRGGTLVQSAAQQRIVHETHIHMDGKAQSLADLIDMRVTHGIKGQAGPILAAQVRRARGGTRIYRGG
jgi:hypothetical protein